MNKYQKLESSSLLELYAKAIRHIMVCDHKLQSDWIVRIPDQEKYYRKERRAAKKSFDLMQEEILVRMTS